uniref:Prosaposin n=1 Tax=Leptobrachium leishanense TaxID=445787 RepID=A0A8C5PPD9_9ANUR
MCILSLYLLFSSLSGDMKLLVVLCCLLHTVSASLLLGTEQCIKGPPVWCDNIQTAFQCGAIKHCQQTVWNKPTIKSVPCDLCKQVMTILGNILKNNCTEDNPGVICQALHLCQSLQHFLASLKPLQQLQTSEIPESDGSELVYLFIAKVLQEPVQAILKALEQVCHNVPGTYKHKCDHFVEVYSPDIIRLLEQDFPPILLCRMLNICSQGQSANFELNSALATSVGDCKICKMFVEYMDIILNKNATKQRILKELEKICSCFPKSLQSQCSDMISEYEPLLLEILLQMLNPDHVCQMVGMCPSSKLPLLGTDKCTLGPSYWCKDMSTAALCNQ